MNSNSKATQREGNMINEGWNIEAKKIKVK